MNGSGFPGAIWPQEAKDDPRRYLQREVIHGFDCAKGAGKVFCVNDWLRHTIQLAFFYTEQYITEPLTVCEKPDLGLKFIYPMPGIILKSSE